MKKRIPMFDDFLIEGKQVGLLYHYTYLINAIQIIDENTMKIGQLHPSISFTRDKNFHKRSFLFNKEGRDIVFVLDGDKLSNNYKITPYSYFSGWTGNKKTAKGGGDGEDQSEEMIDQDIRNIKKYIVRIALPDPNVYDGSVTIRGLSSNDFLKKLTGENMYKQKYVDIEDALSNVNDVKDYFENKGFKINFYK